MNNLKDLVAVTYQENPLFFEGEEANPEYVIGIDMGATNMRIAIYQVFNSDLGVSLKEVKQFEKFSFNKDKEEWKKAIVNAAEYAKLNLGLDKINIGIAPPGPMNIKEGWIYPTNLSSWGQFEIKNEIKKIGSEVFKKSLDDIIVEFDNDVNTQATWFANLSEYKKNKRIFLANPGTGYGGGLVLRDEIGEFAVAREAVEIGWMRHTGLKYGFDGDNKLTLDLEKIKGKIIDDRKFFLDYSIESNKTHVFEEFVSGRGLYFILIDILGGSNPEFMKQLSDTDVKYRSKMIAENAKSDVQCRKALEIMGFHFGHSLYVADKLGDLDKIIWYGNTAEFDSEIMKDAVYEGYASNFKDKTKGLSIIKSKVDIITHENIKGKPEFGNVGCRGAALSVTKWAQAKKKNQVPVYIAIDLDGMGVFGYAVGEDGSKKQINAFNLEKLAYSGTDSYLMTHEKVKTYNDVLRGEFNLFDKYQAIGEMLGNAMVFHYPDEARPVYFISKDKDKMKKWKDVIWEAGSRFNKFAEPGRQFEKVDIIYATSIENLNAVQKIL